MQQISLVNWKERDAVIAYAKSLGPGMTVIKHATRPNYNIVHSTRLDLINKPSVKVEYVT